jgi:hypothetical protein
VSLGAQVLDAFPIDELRKTGDIGKRYFSALDRAGATVT